MCTGVGDGAVNLKVNCCSLSVVEESPLVLSLSDAKPSEAEGFAASLQPPIVWRLSL